jgi:hypothetical protein
MKDKRKENKTLIAVDGNALCIGLGMLCRRSPTVKVGS